MIHIGRALDLVALGQGFYSNYGADSTSMSGLAKDTFAQGVSEGVNNSFPLQDVFKTEDVDWRGGDGEVWSHHTGRNVSPMWVGEDTAFATAGQQTHVKGRKDMRKLMARLRLTQEAMDDYTSSEASFRNGMTDEKTRLVDDIAKRKEFALATDGRGILSLVDSGSSGTTLELDAPGNITGDNFGNRFYQVGMTIMSITPATGAIEGSVVQVVAANSDGSDVTTSAAHSFTENNYIVQSVAGATDAFNSSFERAAWGLPALIDDGTNRDNYFGISRTLVPSLKSYVRAAVGAFSIDTAQLTMDVVYQKLGGEIDLIISHPSVRREYIKLLQDDRRYTGGDLQNPDGGTVAMKQGDMKIGGITYKAIRSIGLAQVYFLDSKGAKCKRFVAEPGRFVERGGDIWLQDGTGASARHAFEAWYFCREQYFLENPGKCARWDGITGQTLVVVVDA